MTLSKFHELQRFHTWIWFLIAPTSLVLFGVAIFGIYKQLILGEEFGDNPLSDAGLTIVSLILIAFSVGMIWLFRNLKLEVTVDKRFLTIDMGFLAKRKFALTDIDGVEEITYKPIREYGGWGVRVSILGKGMAYTAKGNKGARLYLRNGRQIIIGSQQPANLVNALTETDHEH